MKTLLIANRGEIAVRIAQAAAEYGLESVAVYSEDDAASLHVARADRSVLISGVGPAAYLSIEGLMAAAAELGADALHPGYGFLSESAELAEACAAAGIQFVGPSPQTLNAFGDKLKARQLAQSIDIPVAPGSDGPTSIDEAKAFFAELGAPIILKAVAGGGGRGMRVVHDELSLEDAWHRCVAEAEKAFGQSAIYAEALLPAARHIEVQIIGDGDAVLALGERDCSIQRRHQKVLEFAPAPGLPDAMRRQLYEHSIALGKAVNYRGLGTVEFLVWDDWQALAFIELNPRLQVEHTVTEAVTGLDLVQLQLAVIEGVSLSALGLDCTPTPQGTALQARVCLEQLQADGQVAASGGTLRAFDPPCGPGVRVDHAAYASYSSNPRFDSLLAKLICHVGANGNAGFEAILAKMKRSLRSFKLDGVEHNLAVLEKLLALNEVHSNHFDTSTIARHLDALIGASAPSPLYVGSENSSEKSSENSKTATAISTVAPTQPPGSDAIIADLQGTVVELRCELGQHVSIGEELLLVDSMKLEHSVRAEASGVIRAVHISAGETIRRGQTLLHIESREAADNESQAGKEIDLEHIRPDLREMLDRHALTDDAHRAEKIAKLHARGKQSARENIAQLTSHGEFIEYGALAIAAQRGRRELDDLQRNTPADGLVSGVGEVNRELFDADASRTAILAYDYSVLAGTQGFFNHSKTDRMIEVIEKTPMPLIFLAEGGGGRPGDVDTQLISSTGLDCTSFGNLAALSGKVPMIGVNAGYCFAGNAAFLGVNDVIIATKESRLGMGGPAMIEGGGLGVVDKNDIGPSDVQVANGTIDILVDTEHQAIDATRRYLSYFQGRTAHWQCDDQRLLRHLVPENRNRAFDMHRIIDTLCDAGSVMELRPDFAPGYITALARIEGETVAVLANNNRYLSGAIDTPCAQKADRFLNLCEKFSLRVLYLVDCPGLMVGPEYDAQGTARAAGDLYIRTAQLSVPTGAIIIRKAYGLGAMAAMGGHSRAPTFCISWPTGEAGPMGIEGAIRLGFKKELEAIQSLEEREQAFRDMIDVAWEQTRTMNGASTVEIDAVIDPQESRRWITRLLR